LPVTESADRARSELYTADFGFVAGRAMIRTRGTYVSFACNTRIREATPAFRRRGDHGMAATEENKRIVRRFLEEGLNGRNLGLLDEVFAPDFVWHGNSFGEVTGLEPFKQVVAPFFAALPDLVIAIDDLVAEDDKVVCRFTARATHTGDFMGIPPTGKAVAWAGNPCYRLVDGKIVEEWFFEDHLGLFQQLGAIPPFGQG
jgi:steroid delta-isomerase-like uncharacterized protein